jgi:hypothetical protein
MKTLFIERAFQRYQECDVKRHEPLFIERAFQRYQEHDIKGYDLGELKVTNKTKETTLLHR